MKIVLKFIYQSTTKQNERIEKYPASRIDDDGKQFLSGLCRPKMLLMARLLVSLGGIIVANNGEFL